MSRVEDAREEQRLELAKQERKLQDTRTDSQRQASAKQFQSLVGKKQSAKSQQDQKNSSQQQQQSTAAQALIARRGITVNQGVNKMAKDRDNQLTGNRQRAADQDHEHVDQRTAFMRDNANKADKASHKPVAQRPDGDGKPHEQKETKEKKGHGAKDAERALESGMLGQGVFQPLTGVAPKQGSGSAGAPLPPSIREMIDEIVAKVHKGVTENGMGMFILDLNPNVLAGSRLTIHNTAGGVAVKVSTGDPDVERLLSSGSTAHELSQALQQKHIRLTSLEVNDNKVIRS